MTRLASDQSHVTHAGRAEPDQPILAPVLATPLLWAPNIAASYVAVGSSRLRYIATGNGPALVLLHTLRTQLDMFHKIIPQLAANFRVYAVDYPGHGYSDAPRASYDADFFVATVSEFLDKLDIQDATIVGESIGGSIALLLAARHSPRVTRVVAINPYDYGRGRGIRRSSPEANLAFGFGGLPIVGRIVMAHGPQLVQKRIMEGGVYDPTSLSPMVVREVAIAGARPGHGDAMVQLIRHWGSWEDRRSEYPNITVPVLLIYGDHDWSYPEEREADRQLVPGVQMRLVEHAGHFLALDKPAEIIQSIEDFLGAARSSG